MLPRDTMKVHWLALLLIIGAALTVPVVSAKIVEKNHGYVITPGTSAIHIPEFARLASSSITQGESQYFSTSVPTGKTSFYTDLNWGNTANSLALSIIAPDATFGPFYDSSDGATDGRINLRIYRSGGIASGTWYSLVYGYQVTGTQSYTYSTSAS